MRSPSWPIATIRGAEAMTDDTIRVEFEVTLDDVADYDARLLLRSQLYRRWRFVSAR
jgi:hypothetical protein